MGAFSSKGCLLVLLATTLLQLLPAHVAATSGGKSKHPAPKQPALPPSGLDSFEQFKYILSRTWLGEHVLSPKRKWTVFAPVDGAFDDLPTGQLAALVKSPKLLFKVVATHLVRDERVTYEQLASGDVRKLKARSDVHLRVRVRKHGGVRLSVKGSPAATVLPEGSVRVGGAVVHPITALLIPRSVRRRLPEDVPGPGDTTCGKQGQPCCSDSACAATGLVCQAASKTCEACGGVHQPCCPPAAGSSTGTCDSSSLGTVSIAPSFGGSYERDQVLICHSINNTCKPCGEIGGPCCPALDNTDEEDTYYDYGSYVDPEYRKRGDPFDGCISGDPERLACSASTDGTCMPVDTLLLDGSLDFTDEIEPDGPLMAPLFLDADYNAFVFPSTCAEDADSVVELPDDLYSDFGDYGGSNSAFASAVRALLPPAPDPLPPLPSFEGCLPTRGGTYNGAFDFDGSTLSSFYNILDGENFCLTEGDFTYADVQLVGGVGDFQVLGYPEVAGQGGYVCDTPGPSEFCNGDGLLPGDANYPALRPFCDITSPFGISYRAANGTVVPLLYRTRLSLCDLADADGYGGPQCFFPSSFSTWGSRPNARRRRCRRRCKRCRYGCGRCRQCLRG